MSYAPKQYVDRPGDAHFATLPALVDHATQTKAHSIDRTYHVQDLRIIADDQQVKLVGPSGQPAAFTHWSFGQFSRMLGAPAGYLRTLSPDVAAACLTDGQSRAGTQDVNLLLQTPNGAPDFTVRAATSDTYARVWDADLYSLVQNNLRSGWTIAGAPDGRPRGASSGDRDSFLCVTNEQNPIDDPSLRHGRRDGTMFRGLLIRNSEVGAASLLIEQILYRYTCTNRMLWSQVIERTFRRRHVGATVARDAVREIVDMAYRWTNSSPARDTAIVQSLIDHEIGQTRAAVVAELKALGATQEQAELMIATAEREEPQLSPRSFWGLAQGATRASQDTQYQDERYQLDKIGALVLRRGMRHAVAA